MQKFFERKQITRTIKIEYATVLRNKIDTSLELHAKATRLANEGNNKNDHAINITIQQYVNSVLDVYYYYVQNEKVFRSLKKHMEKVAQLVLELTKCSQQKEVNPEEFSSIFNKIKDELMILKENCVKLHL